MRILLTFALLLLNTVVTTPALAQTVNGQDRRAGPRQYAAGSGAVAHSFDALQPVLTLGQEIIVQDEVGQISQGKVVSVSGSQLVITTTLNWLPEELAFPARSVRRIETPDSVWWPGAVVGAAVAAGIGALAAHSGCRPPTRCAGSYTLLIGLGAGAGARIDSLTRATIYRRQPETPRVTIAPSLGRDRKAIVARVCF